MTPAHPQPPARPAAGPAPAQAGPAPGLAPACPAPGGPAVGSVPAHTTPVGSAPGLAPACPAPGGPAVGSVPAHTTPVGSAPGLAPACPAPGGPAVGSVPAHTTPVGSAPGLAPACPAPGGPAVGSVPAHTTPVGSAPRRAPGRLAPGGAAGVPGRGLRRFAGPRAPRPETCELCGVAVAEDGHRHLVETERRALVCACTPCALLFDRPGPAAGRFRTVPDRYLTDPGHQLDDGAWDLLRIPVGVAFFFRNAALDRLVALYPSPAGATESELDPHTWQTVLGAGPLAGLLEPDVEALLLRRTPGPPGRTDCFLVPIDICYELVGRMRLLWQGFDGGAEARAALDTFFETVERRATPGSVPEGRRP